MEQKSEEWHQVRKGKMTASHAQAIGNVSKGLESYCWEICSKFFEKEEDEKYTNPDMDRGNELEAEARNIYEMEKNVEVEEVGFIELNDYVGCSPDGLVGDDGGVEFKCHKNQIFFELLLGKREIESKYIWQIQMNLLITGREWWDFVAYNPNYSKDIFIKRIYPDNEKFSKLEYGFKIGEQKIKEIKEQYNNLKN